jgi:hypothetical protein
MAHSTIRGTILYTSNKPDRLGQERGREYFTLTRQADGIDVLLAHCEIDDPPNVIRDVCLALRHEDSMPLDCSVRLTVGDKFEGTGWMRLWDDDGECETFSARDGRVSQSVDTGGSVKWLQAHPIIGDGLLLKLYDLEQGPGKTFYPNIYLTSPDHRGATGPMLFRTGFSIVYVGDEDVEVAAGAFRARHFQITDTAGNLPEEHPPYDIWCTADDDYILLKAAVGGYMQTYYELTELVGHDEGNE